MAVTLGAGAHVFAGGLLPGPPVLLLLVALLCCVCAVALGRPASYRVVATLVIAGQAVVHLVLTAVSGHAGTHSVAATTPEVLDVPAARTRGGVLDDLAVVPEAPLATTRIPQPHWLGHLQDDLTGPRLLMAVAHMVAAAAVAAWLYSGERAFWNLTALVGARVVRPWRALLLLDCSTTKLSIPAERRGRSAVLGSVRQRRTAVNGASGRRAPPRTAAPAFLAPAY